MWEDMCRLYAHSAPFVYKGLERLWIFIPMEYPGTNSPWILRDSSTSL